MSRTPAWARWVTLIKWTNETHKVKRSIQYFQDIFVSKKHMCVTCNKSKTACHIHCPFLHIQLKLESSRPAPSYEPRRVFVLKVTGDPDATVGLVAVDQGVYVLNNKHRLTQKKAISSFDLLSVKIIWRAWRYEWIFTMCYQSTSSLLYICHSANALHR